MTFNSYLPPTIGLSEDFDSFIIQMTGIYEDIANNANSKRIASCVMKITSTVQKIPILPRYGSFIICVQGIEPDFPVLNASLCKSADGVAGSVAVIGSQSGSGSWSGKVLTISSTSTEFQIKHDRAGVVGNFGISIMGML